jgi:hypothetical protein
MRGDQSAALGAAEGTLSGTAMTASGQRNVSRLRRPTMPRTVNALRRFGEPPWIACHRMLPVNGAASDACSWLAPLVFRCAIRRARRLARWMLGCAITPPCAYQLGLAGEIWAVCVIEHPS